MDNMIFSYNRMIRSTETDLSGNWRTSAILTEIQNVSGMHTSSMKKAGIAILPDNICWIISKVHLKVLLPVKAEEALTMSTWCTGISGANFIRFCEFKTENGASAVRSSTAWILADKKSHKIIRPKSIELGLPYGGEEIIEPPGKVILPEISGGTERTVMYSDTDVIGHMNNARYADWICDLFGADKFIHNYISELSITYSSESKPGETLVLKLKDADGCFFVDARPHFSACGKFSAY